MSINKIRKAEKERQESLKQEQFEFFREKKRNISKHRHRIPQ